MGTGFMEATLFSRIVFIADIVAFLFHMIGFYTNSWSVWTYKLPPPYPIHITQYEGLWKYCYATYAVFTCKNFRDLGSWFQAVQAFETLGFIAAIAALVLIVLYVFVPATSGKRIVFILTMLACFAAAGCIILGIIIYGAKVETNLSWSFALCTIAGIIFGICGILLVVDMMKR